jgi:hypothetical protein
VFTRDNLLKVAYVGIGFIVVGALGVRVDRFARAAVPDRLAGGLRDSPSRRASSPATDSFIDWGIEYVIFALGLGLIISNSIGTPEWIKPAVQTEFFVKTGLVILGASLIFSEVLQAGRARHHAGGAGRVRRLVLVLLARPQAEGGRRVRRDALDRGVDLRRLGRDRGLRRDQGRQEEALLRHLAGADRRGADDDRDAVGREVDRHERSGRRARGSAARSTPRPRWWRPGALISDAAMKTGVIVKFSQNALIGVAAFALAIWWALRQGAETGEKPSAAVIWERFPKFVIGFVLASAVFSFLLPPEIVSGTRSALNDIRTWWFALAFVCVGLETRFVDLLTTDRGRPALAFLGAQTINVFWTLLLAWLLFGGVIFAQPAIR